MVTVYGYSDDCIEIHGSTYPEDEIGCFEKHAFIEFSDGALIEVYYGKDGKGIWAIDVLHEGRGNSTLTICDDEESTMYSDLYETDAEIVCVEVKRNG